MSDKPETHAGDVKAQEEEHQRQMLVFRRACQQACDEALAAKDALVARLEGAIKNHRCLTHQTWCSAHAIYHGDSLCAVLRVEPKI